MSDKFPLCPVPGCPNKLASSKQLMCQGHYEHVSDVTKAAIQAYKKDRTSEAFTQAVNRAVGEVIDAELKEKEMEAYLHRMGL